MVARQPKAPDGRVGLAPARPRSPPWSPRGSPTRPSPISSTSASAPSGPTLTGSGTSGLPAPESSSPAWLSAWPPRPGPRWCPRNWPANAGSRPTTTVAFRGAGQRDGSTARPGRAGRGRPSGRRGGGRRGRGRQDQAAPGASVRCSSRGAYVTWASAEDDDVLPYRAFADIVPRRGVRPVRAGLPGPTGRPGGRSGHPGPGIAPFEATLWSADAEVARARLFEAVCTLIGHAAETASLVIVIDDAHSMGRATSALVRSLLGAAPRGRMAVVAGFRTGRVDDRARLNDLFRDHAPELLGLERLTQAGIAACLGAGPDLRSPHRAYRSAPRRSIGSPVVCPCSGVALAVRDRLVTGPEPPRREPRPSGSPMWCPSAPNALTRSRERCSTWRPSAAGSSGPGPSRR